MEPAWIGTCTSRWAAPIARAMVITGISMGGVAVAIGQVGELALSVAALFVAAMLVLPFRQVTVTVDRHEMRVDFSGPYWKPVVLRRSDMKHVSAVEARPMRNGGWGYRGSLRLFHRLAVILRKGPAVKVEFSTGGWFLVTVDDSAGGVKALQTRA